MVNQTLIGLQLDNDEFIDYDYHNYYFQRVNFLASYYTFQTFDCFNWQMKNGLDSKNCSLELLHLECSLMFKAYLMNLSYNQHYTSGVGHSKIQAVPSQYLMKHFRGFILFNFDSKNIYNYYCFKGTQVASKSYYLRHESVHY